MKATERVRTISLLSFLLCVIIFLTFNLRLLRIGELIENDKFDHTDRTIQIYVTKLSDDGKCTLIENERLELPHETSLIPHKLILNISGFCPKSSSTLTPLPDFKTNQNTFISTIFKAAFLLTPHEDVGWHFIFMDGEEDLVKFDFSLSSSLHLLHSPSINDEEPHFQFIQDLTHNLPKIVSLVDKSFNFVFCPSDEISSSLVNSKKSKNDDDNLFTSLLPLPLSNKTKTTNHQIGEIGGDVYIIQDFDHDSLMNRAFSSLNPTMIDFSFLFHSSSSSSTTSYKRSEKYSSQISIPQSILDSELSLKDDEVVEEMKKIVHLSFEEMIGCSVSNFRIFNKILSPMVFVFLFFIHSYCNYELT